MGVFASRYTLDVLDDIVLQIFDSSDHLLHQGRQGSRISSQKRNRHRGDNGKRSGRPVGVLL